MPYTPSTFTPTSWSSPINISGTDLITNLDETINQIVSTDTNSIKNFINYNISTVLSAYLSAEFVNVYNQTLAGSATYATNAQNSATASASSASSALSYLNEFKGTYYGSLASDPIVDPIGNAMNAGDVYFNSTSAVLKYYNGTSWNMWAVSAPDFSSITHSSTSKATPVDADEIPIIDSESSYSLKKLTWANLKATLLNVFAPLSSPAFTGNPTINGVGIGLYPHRNRIINGAMNVNQINGTTAVTPTSNGTYISDMFLVGITQSSKLTFQQVTDAPSGFKYSTKVTVASQYSPLSTDSFLLATRIEGQNITDFKFGTAGAVTINTSLNIKGSIAGTYSVCIKNGNNDRSYIGTITVGTSWSKVSINLVGAQDGTWATDNTFGLQLSIDLGSGSNFNATAGVWHNGAFTRTSDSVTFVNQVAGSTLNITGVQLEKVPTGATQGTDYEWLSYDEELRRCQRYLPSFSTGRFMGLAIGTGTVRAVLPYFNCRVNPTGIVSTSAITLSTLTNGSGGTIAITGLSFVDATFNGARVDFTVASGLTLGQASNVNISSTTLLLTGAQL